jgi:hypothetical protein
MAELRYCPGSQSLFSDPIYACYDGSHASIARVQQSLTVTFWVICEAQAADLLGVNWRRSLFVQITKVQGIKCFVSGEMRLPDSKVVLASVVAQMANTQPLLAAALQKWCSSPAQPRWNGNMHMATPMMEDSAFWVDISAYQADFLFLESGGFFELSLQNCSSLKSLA